MKNLEKYRLKRDFFLNDVIEVAPALLGKVIVFKNQQLVITETEAYSGYDDPASHAFRGKTPRNEIMFGIGGFSYVYFIYGMYHCLNFVTGPAEQPSAVLIRGTYNLHDPSCHWNGPGKMCRAAGIDLTHTKIDIVTSEWFYVADTGITLPFHITPRVGISRGQEMLRRFVATQLPKKSC